MTIADVSAFAVTPRVSSWRSRERRADSNAAIARRSQRVFSAAAAPSAWLDASSIALKELLLLDGGWDGGVSAHISDEAVDTARRLIEALAELALLPEPHIAPEVNGGVILEWESGPTSVEILCLADGTATVDVWDADEAIWNGPLSNAPDPVISAMVQIATSS